MKIDFNRLLDLNYLNSLITQFNAEIIQLREKFVELCSLEKVKNTPIEEVNLWFEQYNVVNDNVIQYIDSDFIDDGWEYADLFLDDMSYSAELKASIEKAALAEIDELNKKIIAHNNEIANKIQQTEESLSIINTMINLLNVDELTSENNISILLDFILKYDTTDEDKFIFSDELARFLITKNKELYLKKEEIDTAEFESELDNIYDSVLNNEMPEDEINDPVYSETILGYYNFYKDILREVGIGDNIVEVMEFSNLMASGIKSTMHSISREDFCIKLGAALYSLHISQNKDKVNNDLMANALMDLSILDRIYEEYDKNKNNIEKMQLSIEEDLSTISLACKDYVDSPFVKKIINGLTILKIELSNNLIDSIGFNEIRQKYKNVSESVSKISAVVKMIQSLDELNNKIVLLMQSYYSNQTMQSDGYYVELSSLQAKVLSLIDKIKDNGYNPEFKVEFDNILLDFQKYTKEEQKTTNSSVELVGFVLFDYDEKFVPYVITDLDPNNRNNLIDNSISHKKIYSALGDYSKLIDDLLIYGEPEVIHGSSQVYYTCRIIDDVCYDDAKKHATGIVRIRPLRSSMVRFMSREAVLYPDTEIHKQVVGLIQELLPNVVISPNEKFSLFINFASALKKTDVDSYVEAIHRNDRKNALYNMFFARENKTKLTDEEYSLLRDIIIMTLDAYKELETKNENLNFRIIDQIGGKKSRG